MTGNEWRESIGLLVSKLVAEADMSSPSDIFFAVFFLWFRPLRPLHGLDKLSESSSFTYHIRIEDIGIKRALTKLLKFIYRCHTFLINVKRCSTNIRIAMVGM